MQTIESLERSTETKKINHRNKKKNFDSDIHIRLNNKDFDKLKYYCDKNNKVISKVIREKILEFLSTLEEVN